MKPIAIIGISVGVLGLGLVGVKLYYGGQLKKDLKDANKAFEGEYSGSEEEAGWNNYLKPGFKIRGVVKGDGSSLKVTSMKTPTSNWISVEMPYDKTIPKGSVIGFKLV